MSILNVQEVIIFPSGSSLDAILHTDHVDIISPFYSEWALRKLEKKNLSRVRMITRLPTQYHSAPSYLDNDPRPLRRAMHQLGSALAVFALPNVHAKLYLTDSQAWLGSANFTRNGFSNKGELLIRVSPAGDVLPRIFHKFLGVSTKVSKSNVDFLTDCFESGLSKIDPIQNVELESRDIPIAESVSYEDFGRWLESQHDSDYIRDRILNKNRMSGHVYSGFHGILSFVAKHPTIGRRLLKNKQPDEADLARLADFVRQFGAKFGGPRGGTWNSKLSTRIGGTQSGGGAGDAVVKQLLIDVPKYMRHKHLL
jgi:hypothetical protein